VLLKLTSIIYYTVATAIALDTSSSALYPEEEEEQCCELLGV